MIFLFILLAHNDITPSKGEFQPQCTFCHLINVYTSKLANHVYHFVKYSQYENVYSFDDLTTFPSYQIGLTLFKSIVISND